MFARNSYILIQKLAIKDAANSLTSPQVRFHQIWRKSIPPHTIYMPNKIEDRTLPQLPYSPTSADVPPGVVLPMKYPKANLEMRGPERIHNQLIYRQFGIIALGGGALLGEHYDIIMNRINKYMDTERFFAAWRLDPPWKPVSRKSMGKKMGGGKGKVHHYEFPVKAGRIIVEIGGIGEFGEVERILTNICKKLPFYAIPITQEMMDNLAKEKAHLDTLNHNPFSYRYLIRNNFSDSQRKVTPYDRIWGGTYF